MTAAARDPVRRAFGAITLHVRYLALEGEFIAGAQMADLVAHREPHFTLHDQRPQRKRVRMPVHNRARRPTAS